MTTKKILIVDPSPLALAVTKQTLEIAGYKVITAADGQSGLIQFYLGQPDLVVLELMLPQIDGLEACRRIRSGSNVPIIIHTALESPEYMLQAIHVGANDYLVKPVLPPMLQVRVETTLKGQARRDGLRPAWLTCVVAPQPAWADLPVR